MTPPRAGIASPRRPAPAPARPRHLEVVGGRPAPGRRPPKAFAAFAAGATACALLAMVTVRVLMGQTGFTESELQRSVHGGQLELEQLQVSVAQLRSPERVFTRAREMGLVEPRALVYLVPTPAASAARGAQRTAPSPAAEPRSAPSSPGRGGR